MIINKIKETKELINEYISNIYTNKKDILSLQKEQFILSLQRIYGIQLLYIENNKNDNDVDVYINKLFGNNNKISSNIYEIYKNNSINLLIKLLINNTLDTIIFTKDNFVKQNNILKHKICPSITMFNNKYFYDTSVIFINTKDEILYCGILSDYNITSKSEIINIDNFVPYPILIYIDDDFNIEKNKKAIEQYNKIYKSIGE